MLTSERLELVEDWSTESQIDREHGIVRDVLLCGHESKNGYKILPSAFGTEQKAKDLYEGVLVFLNHAKEGKHRTRDMQEAAGVIQNVRLKDGKPRGDIKAFTQTDPGKVLLDVASVNPPPKGCGLSHVARYGWNSGMDTVVAVEQVVTVDLVTSPATTNTLREQEGEMTLEALQKELDAVRTERDDFKRQAADAKTKLDSVSGELASLKAEQTAFGVKLTGKDTELAELRKKLDEFETKEALAIRREQVQAALKTAGLNPDDAVQCSKVFVEHLLKIEDEALRLEAISDRVSLLETAKGAKLPVSSKRPSPAPAEPFDVNKVAIEFFQG